jgi:hypothetical protein
MTTWYLVAYLLINSAWLPGSSLDGWHPMRIGTFSECMAAIGRARTNEPPAGVEGIVWGCEARKAGA